MRPCGGLAPVIARPFGKLTAATPGVRKSAGIEIAALKRNALAHTRVASMRGEIRESAERIVATARIAARVQRRDASADRRDQREQTRYLHSWVDRLQQAACRCGTLGVKRAFHRGMETFDVSLEKPAPMVAAHQRAAVQINTISPTPNMADNRYPKLALRTSVGA